MGRADGTIITFYSYKGGTGRSMAVANTAWILASNGLRILVIDWDLEAPGLHRYFHPFLPDKDLRLYRGILDLVWDFAAAAIDTEAPSEPGWHEELAQISPYAMSLDYEFPGGGTVDFVPAGRQDSSYAALVTSFDWENFYERLGGGRFLEALKRNMRERYDYVLVDSRTGLSDIAGICTVQLPDVLVNCFSLSTQAIDGAAAVAASVGRQRRDGQVRIFPVPMRVEDGEQDKLDAARDYARSCFGKFLSHIPDPDRYWGEVEVPYKSFYAYEEILATIGDRPLQQNTILSATERVVGYVTAQRVTALEAAPPESERRALLARFQRSAPEVTDDEFRLAGVTPRIFIAYSYESAEHFEAVRELWYLLRARGVDARMDLPPNQRPPNWSEWFLEQLGEADLVVVVVSPAFKRFAKLETMLAPDRALGAEVLVIRESRDRVHDRLLPVVMPGGSIADTPGFLTDMEPVSVGELTASGIEDLLRRALRQGGGRGFQASAYDVEPQWRTPEPMGKLLQAQVHVLAALVARELMEAPSSNTPLFPVRWSMVSGYRSSGTLPRPRGRFDDLVNCFLAAPSGKLVILGAPGSGKSTLATRLASELLSRSQGGPVPLLLPAIDWRPDRESLDSWMVRHLRRRYPEFCRTLEQPDIEEVVSTGSVIPVVDGLDELPSFRQYVALRALSGSSFPMIVTCRSLEYWEAPASKQALDDIAVIELELLSVEDVIGSLRAGNPEPGRWSSLISYLRTQPGSVLAAVLSRPVMLRVVQDACSEDGFDPAELVDPKLDRKELEGRLFGLFITAAYAASRPDGARNPEPGYDRESAVRWLAFLARSMRMYGTHDLAWWQLAHWSRAGVRVLMLGVVGVWAGISAFVVSDALAVSLSGKVLAAGVVATLASMVAFLLIPLKPPKRPSGPLVSLTRTPLRTLRWLYLPLRSSADTSRRLSPKASLHADRTVTTISGLVWAVTAVSFSVAITASAGVDFGSVLGPVAVFTIGAILVRFSMSAWRWYTVTRLWLALRGQLPWRLMGFLDDAHRRGVLRQSGAVYQFRYRALQERLARFDAD